MPMFAAMRKMADEIRLCGVAYGLGPRRALCHGPVPRRD